MGFIDTLEGVRRTKPGPLANDYAAVPSYHFGWIFLAVVGVWWCWRSWLLRAGSLAFAGLMWWSIVVTGNHFFFDMVLGALLVLLALFLSFRLEAWLGSDAPRRPTVNVGGHRLPF
jgi:membrane-associated phospholipid phosphatase